MEDAVAAAGAMLSGDHARNRADALNKLVDPQLLTVVADSGGKLLLTNHGVVE